MTITHILGYPRIGEKRELKFALEGYWRGELSQSELLDVGSDIRTRNWAAQHAAGLSYVTVGDFAWYDHVLSTSLLLGHIPSRHHTDTVNLDTLFNMARGRSQETHCPCANAASDMTKWFNTNYHYLVPEFSKEDTFDVTWRQLFEEIEQAQSLGYKVKPVLLGPVSYLFLGKSVEDGFDRLEHLSAITTAYQKIFEQLEQLGIDWLQIDEPILTLELDRCWSKALVDTYHQFDTTLKLLLTTYFDSIEDNFDTVLQLPVDGIHIDIEASPEQLTAVLTQRPNHWIVSVGAVNGRNVWRTDLHHQAEILESVKETLGDKLWIGSSCSLIHSPVDLDSEQKIDVETGRWFAFAKQKVSEIVLLGEALSGSQVAKDSCLRYSAPIWERKNSTKVNKVAVQQRVDSISSSDSSRTLCYSERAHHQRETLNLPLLPTTTIGSFPQTADIRKQRSAYRTGKLNQIDYESAMKAHIDDAVQRQEALGLDVLVHGEAERNDMVEYFAENLSGFATTEFGWVQSYGSRCVKPAIVVADIERTDPITVQWSTYAQSLTQKQMKGMLTGPVTILCWTFPREDISRKTIARQLAFALRDEVDDLQNNGINIIQIDEPAIREGLPLKRKHHQDYLDWAVEAFKISAGIARPETQIHTHMCYSEFNEIIDSVAKLDADVITIETSRSNMDLLKAFEAFNYPNEIGPGIYDIHSPNIPDQDWMITLLEKAAEKIPVERLWVNPDCGLKTRNWKEVDAALKNMVVAAKTLRSRWC